MNGEQLRAEFEVCARNKNYDLEAVMLLSKPPKFSRYANPATQKAWEAYQAGRAALQSQKPEPNNLMLSAVIRMPFEMAMADPISRMQFYQRAQQALDELDALQSQDREDAERLKYLLGKVCMYQSADYGCKFEILNLPPHFGDCEPDPIQPFLAAIDHARRIEEKK